LSREKLQCCAGKTAWLRAKSIVVLEAFRSSPAMEMLDAPAQMPRDFMKSPERVVFRQRQIKKAD
jgi:hypothetical protein